MKLSVQLVTWNGSKYVEYLFDSLRKQIFSDWQLIILDNASSDDTVEKIKKELIDFPFQYQIIENKENKGFAGGHNQVFVSSESDYVLLLNQDMYLMPDCLERMVKFMDENKNIAGVSPRLMRWNFGSLPLTKRENKREFAGDLVSNFSATPPTPSWKEGDVETSFTDLVDSLGLKIFRNRRVIEQYTQENWTEIKTNFSNNVLETFGLSGAFPMFRRSMINEILLNGQIFDEDYHSYKEDVDLAFRMLSHGLKSRVLLDVVAYHDRAGAGPKDMNDKAAFESKKKQSGWVKYNSYKNHLMTLYKNEYWQNYLLDLPWIKWYELKKFIYFVLFDRGVLKGLGEMWKMRRQLKDKRYKIKNKRKVGWKEIRKWWK